MNYESPLYNSQSTKLIFSETKANLNSSSNPNLVTTFKIDDNTQKKKRVEKINFSYFLESLAISALKIKNDLKEKSVEKLLYFVEKMIQSDGVQKSLIRSGQT